jgi:(2R)-sulfolactate sulfo-lyase subunit alpha
VNKKKFWIHADGDSVGVAVADVNSGETVVGVFMDTGKELAVKAKNDIPLGHKIALRALKNGEDVVEYGTVIGVAKAPIREGEHVHVHNIKSQRWTKK